MQPAAPSRKVAGGHDRRGARPWGARQAARAGRRGDRTTDFAALRSVAIGTNRWAEHCRSVRILSWSGRAFDIALNFRKWWTQTGSNPPCLSRSHASTAASAVCPDFAACARIVS